MAALEPALIEAQAKESVLWSKYSTEIDRESARELLAKKMGTEEAATPSQETDAGSPQQTPKAPKKAPAPKKKKAPAPKKEDSVVVDYVRSREGRQMITNVARGVFDLLKKR